ncbi:hypothetical protein ACTI_85610 [Actinoplanes sp. OR16]|uniref:phage tail sheath subtilisin-like domain-containing protein n=1 Tax=Actinoplanes sp. OR16 TaxID=946334 RepID=UPI000F6DFA65|nr:phage tail sheath subtilisin-like domain-containing protein [Actinoplanes sp. OR16]BBH71876.1 hypothetical protein ACTI_85610 [Actinoplanes sp. OR16]
MSEIITETILPGTYIQVNAEGLLSVGPIATGNVGVVGTAEKGGPEIQTLSGFEEARARFGEMGEWDDGNADDNLTLVRSLKLIFDNGAGTVYGRRVFDPAKAVAATLVVADESSAPAMVLEATTPGAWGNRLQLRIEDAEAQEQVNNEAVVRGNGSFALSAAKLVEPPAATGEDPVVGTVTVRSNGLVNRYQMVKSAAGTQTVRYDAAARTFTFATQPAAAAEVYASYRVPRESLRKVTLRYGNVQEVYVVPSLSYLQQALSDPGNPSTLVRVKQRTADGLPARTATFTAFANGVNGSASTAQFEAALDGLLEQNIQILVVPRPFSEIASRVLAHVERAESLGRERIAVVGADSSAVDRIMANTNDVADKRVVLVAPGLTTRDGETGRTMRLPAYYTAAAVAGKISSLAPHISLTNKTLAGIDGLQAEYNYGDTKALVLNRVLALQRKRGIRVVKGISTDDGAFRQITLRRIVDYVKEGTRQGANQYIGLLNNRRVRENLRTTLDGFLADLVVREYLTGYKLAVFADRPMEIRGEVLVTMDLQPTFCIDVIRVVMNLA